MQKTSLIRYLARPNRSRAPSPATVAQALDWSETTVNKVIADINADGIYAIRPGRGGGLTLTGGITDEKQTYGHIENNIEDWVRQNVYGRHGVTMQKTKPTHKGRLPGKWSNPDFAMLCVHKFLHAPNSQLELVTVEAKHAAKQFDVSAVYEALAQTRASHYGLLFFYDDPVDSRSANGLQDVLEEIKIECVRLGIGLVITEYPCDPAYWNYLIPAKEHKPDMRRVDAFINDAFDTAEKDWLARAL
ncbi:hypothetical protein [Paramagnetospirillum magneticum]|uniref:Uncharacterized protein n=1 Tax=Paramagnetospirillum magneticum (strain ATCC 700264 / AMB-1) TaxID=342108 RepID=Q2WAA1_PARM1|nr:hypothetical protein [Paramagnetospirillum magneticum]BAE49224.1 hypothetical protein amb0420 [Paramagnetospirillum magneticum AMB-1]